MEQKNILVTFPVTDKQKHSLEMYAPGSHFLYRPREEVTTEDVHNANIIIGNVTPSQLVGASKLEWLQLDSAGTNGYLDPGVLPPGTKLTNATGAYGLAISEYMIGVVLELIKKLHYYRDNQNQRLWKDEGHVTSIQDSRTLVVGLGDIGNEFARKMDALGSHVNAVKRRPSDKPEYIEELYLLKDLDKLLPEADIVALCLPGTEQTRHLFNAKRIKLMKESAILLNVGRGTVVDTEALCDALEKGQLYGAALDVTEPEPLPPDHRLWKFRNVVITPHTSGQYHLPETLNKIVRISAENLMRFMNHKELRNEVDFTSGYKK